MAIYTVYAPPAERAADAERFQFVKDGFSWPALVVPVLWLAWRRMWVVLCLYIAASVGLEFLNEAFDGALPGVFAALMTVLFALEANSLRRWTLARSGWSMIGVAEGRRLAEAEIRFFADWQSPGPAPAEAPRPAAPAVPAAGAGIIGLFPIPEGGR